MVISLDNLGLHRDVSGHPAAGEMERLVNEWANMPLFSHAGDADSAHHLARLTLGHAYLFGRLTLSGYEEHFAAVRRTMSPLRGREARVAKAISDMISGESWTNNVSGRKDVCQAHYWDMREALDDIADENERRLLDKFEKDASSQRTDVYSAFERSGLWNDSMASYARVLEEKTGYKMTTFLIGVLSEDAIATGYMTILNHLPGEERYAKFRNFMQRHIELDKEGHGPATVDWFNLALEHERPDPAHLSRIMGHTREFLEARIATYE